MIRYKLTDAQSRTYNNTQWGPGITHTAPGNGKLCSAGWIHVYTHPDLAVLLDPVHGNFGASALLWECEVSGANATDHGLKEGWQSVTTLRQIERPAWTTTQRVAFAILCASEVYAAPAWLTWADRWLSGEGRSGAATAGAAWAAEATAAAARAAWAAWAAAAAWAARAAAESAWAAEEAARAAATQPLDMIALAQSAKEIE